MTDQEVVDGQECPRCESGTVEETLLGNHICGNCGRVWTGRQYREQHTDDRGDIPDEDPYEHPERWVFYCDDCDLELTVEAARDHQADHRIAEEYRP